MQTNIPSKEEHTTEEINDQVQGIMKYLSENPYATVEAEINGASCIVIAAVESEKMENVQPMFILPSPELILHVVDTDDKKPIFSIAREALN
jgi:hypothetical protein